MRLLQRSFGRRIASMLLCGILLLMGIVACCTSASAEVRMVDGIVLDSFDENADVRTCGDWYYYINPAGYATICGYADAAVDYKWIPETLDGVAVTAIAANALAQLDALELIVIDGNVTTFGEDVFGANQDVTIAGYQGSAALTYARENGLNAINLSDETLVESAVDFQDVDPELLRFDGDVIEMRIVEAARVRPGSVIVLQDSMDTGFAYEVTGMEMLQDCVRVHVSVMGIDEAHMEVYEDMTLVCRDCGAEFVFAASEQQFYADKGFQNAPSRCPECRAARSTQNGDANSGESKMYDVICDGCGQLIQIPFKPSGRMPVYCSSCYEALRQGN